MPESQAIADVLVTNMTDALVVFTGTVPTFNVLVYPDSTDLILLPEHNNRMIVCTNEVAPRIVLPPDVGGVLSSLPRGFAATLVLDNDFTSDVLEVVSGDALLELPVRRAAHYSDGAGATFAPPHMPITVIKIGVNRWMVTGHYVP